VHITSCVASSAAAVLPWAVAGPAPGASQSKGITRIFTDYILNKDKPTFDTIGNTCIIPTAVIKSIKKILL